MVGAFLIIACILIAFFGWAACAVGGRYDDMNGMDDNVQWENRYKED